MLRPGETVEVFGRMIVYRRGKTIARSSTAKLLEACLKACSDRLHGVRCATSSSIVVEPHRNGAEAGVHATSGVPLSSRARNPARWALGR
jgi:hypothetical protein